MEHVEYIESKLDQLPRGRTYDEIYDAVKTLRYDIAMDIKDADDLKGKVLRLREIVDKALGSKNRHI